MKKRAIALFIISCVMYISMLPRISCESFAITYRVSGVYKIENSEYTGAGMMEAIFSESNIEISGYINDLPYNINLDSFMLTSSEMEQRKKDGVNLTIAIEPNPYVPFFGLTTFTGYFENDLAKYKVVWHGYWGFAVYMEIEKKGELMKILRITYNNSSLSLYEGLDEKRVSEIEFFAFLFSPAGLIMTSLPFLTFTILLVYIFSRKKKYR